MSFLDICIVVIYLLITFVAGLLTKKYIGSVRGLPGGRTGDGFVSGIASLISSEIGIITYMYFANSGI